MIGAIIGDIIGSPYEFDNIKQEKFPLFGKRSYFTDDTILSIAICEAAMDDRRHYAECLRKWAERYPSPYGGYGGMFNKWLYSESDGPYNSYGNGSAMRVSSIGWLFDDLETVLNEAGRSAEVTHNHPEGIKGAKAVAASVFMARTGKSKEEIKHFVETEFKYDLNRTCDEIRPSYSFDGSCEGSVPEAIIAFLDSNNFEHAIRLAVSLGGDSDTIACITGAIAEAYYQSIPLHIAFRSIRKLPADLLSEMICFLHRTRHKKKQSFNYLFIEFLILYQFKN